jgi:hypothetical protein
MTVARHVQALVASALLGCAAPALGQPEQAFTPIRHWDTIGRARIGASDTVLRLEAGSVQSSDVYGDFELRFEYRAGDPRAEARLLLRTIMDFDAGLEAYEAVIDGGPGRGRLTGRRQGLREVMFESPTPVDPGTWVACTVRVQGDAVTVSLDGTVVARATELTTLLGHVGFSARGHGGIDLRGIRIASLEPADPFPGVPTAGDPGVTAPKILKRVPPSYTRAAMIAKAQGVAVLAVDGRPVAILVKKAPHPDLAVQAVSCLRQWRFTPATKDGVPIAIRATMEVGFKLK